MNKTIDVFLLYTALVLTLINCMGLANALFDNNKNIPTVAAVLFLLSSVVVTLIAFKLIFSKFIREDWYGIFGFMFGVIGLATMYVTHDSSGGTSMSVLGIALLAVWINFRCKKNY